MKKRFTQFSLLLVSAFSLGVLLTANAPAVSAVTAADWKAGNIIDDGIFYNGNDMSANDIQAFMNSKVTSCDTWGTKTSEHGGGTRAQYGTNRGLPPPYVCMKDYSMNTQGYGADGYCGAISGGQKSSAQIIKDVSSACGVGSKVLLVLLQKEQSLVTDDWPFPSQYQKATGFACPDTAPCDAQYAGFFNQVYRAAKQYKIYRGNPGSYRYKARQNNSILFNVASTGCPSSNVYIENDATAGLYIYTPYQPNQAALNNMYGTGDGCSAYGNRNFWRMYSDWFGSTRGTPYAWQYVGQYAYIDSNKSIGVDLNNAGRGQRVFVTVQARNTGNTTWTNTGNNPVRIGTNNPQNRNSIFCDSTWISCARPANLKEPSVAPGATGTFEFWYNIPAVGGTHNEYFNLLAEGSTWMNDLGLYFRSYAAPPSYTWQLTGQYAYTDVNKTTTANLSQLNPGQRVFIGYYAKNTGNVTWLNTGANAVKSGTNNPKDRSSSFCDQTWPSCTRSALLKEASVAPGAIGTFEFWYKAPSNPGEYREHFLPLSEGVNWMNDIGMQFYTQVGVGPREQGATEILGTNQQLTSNQSIVSADNRYRLVMQGDGNLVLYSYKRALWSSGTAGKPATRLVMQGDGNLVIYDTQGKAYWSSGTAGKGSSSLVMQNDGNLVVYTVGGNASWFTRTSGQL